MTKEQVTNILGRYFNRHGNLQLFIDEALNDHNLKTVKQEVLESCTLSLGNRTLDFSGLCSVPFNLKLIQSTLKSTSISSVNAKNISLMDCTFEDDIVVINSSIESFEIFPKKNSDFKKLTICENSKIGRLVTGGTLSSISLNGVIQNTSNLASGCPVIVQNCLIHVLMEIDNTTSTHITESKIEKLVCKKNVKKDLEIIDSDFSELIVDSGTDINLVKVSGETGVTKKLRKVQIGRTPNGSLHIENCENTEFSVSVVEVVALRIKNVKKVCLGSPDSSYKITNDLKIDEVSSLAICGMKCQFNYFLINSSKVIYFTTLDCDFTNGTFFDDCDFESSPDFLGSELYPNTNFSNCTFKDFHRESQGRYRYLKRKLDSSGNSVGECLFSSLEMRARFENQSWKSTSTLFEKTCGFFALYINNFGHSLLRPFAWYFGLLVFFAYITHEFELIVVSDQFSEVSKYEGTWIKSLLSNSWIHSTYYSIVNSIVPLKLVNRYDVIVSSSLVGLFFSVIHAFISSILLYLGIAGIKKRFRQK